MIVYDITNKSSFENLAKWINQLRAFSRSGVLNVLLVGNKTDMDAQRQVSYEQAAAYAAKNEMAFMETSCVTLSNVHEAFQSLVSRTVEQMLAKYQQPCPPPSSASVSLPIFPVSEPSFILTSHSINDDGDDDSHSVKAKSTCSIC
jgi:GTPase SAR1 family protein